MIELSRELLDQMEMEYQQHCQMEGVTLVGHKRLSPMGEPHHATNNDCGLWTGTELAMAAYRYALYPTTQNGKALNSALHGVYILTHVSGIPGVVARFAYPLETAWDQVGYDRVKSLAMPGNEWGKRLREGTVHESDTDLGRFMFQTRATRDQITGILLGLTVAYCFTGTVQDIIRNIVNDLYDRMQETNWSLRDHTGSTYGSTAHRLDAPLRLLLKALHRKVNGDTGKRPWSLWLRLVPVITFWYNRIFTATYVYNLNLMTAHALWLLQEQHGERKSVRRWHDQLMSKVRGDNNPHFDMLDFAMTDTQPATDSMTTLHARATAPYRGPFSFHRDREDWFPGKDYLPGNIGPQLDVLFPEYLGRFWTQARTKKRD